MLSRQKYDVLFYLQLGDVMKVKLKAKKDELLTARRWNGLMISSLHVIGPA